VLYFQLMLFGVCIGLVSGMLGIGGGIILVPGLILLFDFSQREAQGTSLAALSVPIFIFAAAVYYKYGYVRLPATAAIAAGIMVGAFAGAILIAKLPQASIVWLRLAFGGLLLYIGMQFVLQSAFGRDMPRFVTALPAGISLIIVAIAAWIRGRRPASMNLPPPDGHTEYHI